jgi:hypothetical protein
MMGKLRDQMLMDLQLSGIKPRTQKNYLREVENLAKYFNRSPAELGETELKQYMLYMINERRLSDGTFRFYVAGLKFLYRTTLKREWVSAPVAISRADSPVKHCRSSPREIDVLHHCHMWRIRRRCTSHNSEHPPARR